MASDPFAVGEPTAPAWAPSEASRGWMLLGCVAVLLDAGLSTAGMGAGLLEAKAGGIELGRALEWAAVLPQLGVLAALLTLAREANSRSLWKSGIGFLGVFVLFLAFDLAMDESLKKQVRNSAALVSAVGIVGLLVVALGPWPRFAPKDGSAPPAKQQGKGCLATAALPILFIVAKIFAKGLPRMKLGAEGWVAIEGCVLLVLALVFVVWFAWTKIRLAEKFGITATLLGGFEILVLLCALAGLGSFFAVAATPLANNDEAEVERLFNLWMRYGAMGGMVAYVIWAALMAWLFLTIRKLGERDWRFQFTADGVKPWT